MPDLNPYLLFTRQFDAADIQYAVGGGVAVILYGEPRLTLDLDVLLDLHIGQVGRFLDRFPESEFYVPPEEVIRMEIARGARGHFNMYHHASGVRADIYLRSRDPLDMWSLDNAVRVDIGGGSLAVAPPEAVIVRKLEYFREGGSDKHARDIRTILAMQELLRHRALMEQWIAERGLQNVWRDVLRELEG